MSEQSTFDSTLRAPRHWIAVAAILACGMVGGALILRTSGSAAPATAAGHADAASHDDGEHHDDAKKDKPGKPDGSASDPRADDSHGHDDKEDGEGLIKFSEAQSRSAGIVLAQAGAAGIRKEIILPGEVRLDEDRTAHVVPRVAGVVASVHAQLGERVAKGQLLAVIQSAAISDQRSEWQTVQKRLALARTTHEREKKLWEERISAEQDYLQARQALQEAEIAVANAARKLASIGASTGGDSSRYELRAPFSGVVVEKHLTVGESVTESTASFTVSDLGSVWAEMNVSASQLPYVRVGSQASVHATAFDSSAEGRVAYVGALIGEQTRTAPARVALANPQGVWRPGLFVDVKLVTDESKVSVAVDTQAIQRPDGKESVVFVPAEGGYRAQVVELGKTDGRTTEVTAGLAPGQAYVREGSFMLKAELGKASAEHSH